MWRDCRGVRIKRWLLWMGLVLGLLSASLAAAAQGLPDTSAWPTYDSEQYGLSLRVPPDWRLDEVSMRQHGDVLSFRAPDRPNEPPAACGIKVFPVPAGKNVDIDDYIGQMSKEDRFLKAIGRTFGSPYVHHLGTVELSDRKAFHAIFSGNLTNFRWTVMNFDAIDGASFLKVQCVMRPEEVEEYYYTFMAIGLSLAFRSS